MFSNLKLKIGLSRLKKQLKGHKRQKMVYNLETARRIGIVSNATSSIVFEQTMQLATFLNSKHIDVSLLVFCPEKEVPQKYYLRKNVVVFNKKELNWYGKPLHPAVDDFISSNFDILIDLSLQEIFSLRWIASLSKAKFKVGTLQYFANPNDMVISLKKEQGIEILIEQLKHYLNLINNRFAQQEEWLKS